MRIKPGTGEKIGRTEAATRAEEKRSDPAIRAWLKRARRLFKDQPDGCWLYMQEDQLHLMVRGPNGEKYVKDHGGSEQESSIASILIPGADAGAW